MLFGVARNKPIRSEFIWNHHGHGRNKKSVSQTIILVVGKFLSVPFSFLAIGFPIEAHAQLTSALSGTRINAIEMLVFLFRSFPLFLKANHNRACNRPLSSRSFRQTYAVKNEDSSGNETGLGFTHTERSFEKELTGYPMEVSSLDS